MKDERGLSLIELMIAMSITSLIVLVTFAVLYNVQHGVEVQIDRGNTLDTLRLAQIQIDREVRSARAITLPTSSTMRAYTLNNDIDRGGIYCVEYRTNGGDLQTRQWNPTTIIVGTTVAWRVLAESTSATFSKPAGHNNKLIHISITSQHSRANSSNIVLSSDILGWNINGSANPCDTVVPL